MDNLFLLLFFASIICLIVGLVKPSAFSSFIKGDITRKKIGLIFGGSVIVFLILFGISTDTSKKQGQTTQTSPATTNTEVTQTETQKSSNPVLAQHKVIPEDIHGTTRIIHVIVQSNIKRDEIIAINDNLISDYSSGLTHLNIEYFDDEVIAADYFQKLSQVSEAEGEKLFKHYIGTYTMNKTTGYNKLQINEGNNWVTIKEY